MMKQKICMLLAALILAMGVGCAGQTQESAPSLLENDPASMGEETPVEEGDEFIFEDEDVPLADLPDVERSAPGEEPAASSQPAEDPYEGLTETQIKYVEEVVELVNEARTKEGLAPLTLDMNLRKAAQVRAKECVSYFSHTRPDGRSYKTAIEEAGVISNYTGENAACGHSSPGQVVKAWLGSEGHRANILNEKFTKIGVGLEKNTGNGYPGYSWIQTFIR